MKFINASNMNNVTVCVDAKMLSLAGAMHTCTVLVLLNK